VPVAVIVDATAIDILLVVATVFIVTGYDDFGGATLNVVVGVGVVGAVCEIPVKLEQTF
jgi:hypothetical protein